MPSSSELDLQYKKSLQKIANVKYAAPFYNRTRKPTCHQRAPISGEGNWLPLAK